MVARRRRGSGTKAEYSLAKLIRARWWLDRVFYFSPEYTDAYTLADIIRARKLIAFGTIGSERSGLWN